MVLSSSSLRILFITSCTFFYSPVIALPALEDAAQLTLDEIIGTTYSPPTTTDWGIPANPEARGLLDQVKPIPLPVFDPSTKFVIPPNENNARFIPMPKGSYHIEFDKDHPFTDYNASAPIHVDLTKYIGENLQCGFCLKIVGRLKEEITKKGSEAFTQELIKSCEDQRHIGQAHFSCKLIEKTKVDQIKSDSAENLCIAEKHCKDSNEVLEADQRMDELEAQQKEEDELRVKWRLENEKQRQIVMAEEEKWRKEFKRTHEETIGFKPLRLNLPEGEVEGSGEDDWKPDFGDWNDNMTTTTAETPLGSSTPGTGVEEEATKVDLSKAESTPTKLTKLTPGSKPAIDFLTEMGVTAVVKDAIPTTSTTEEAVAEAQSQDQSGTTIDSLLHSTESALAQEEDALKAESSPSESAPATTTEESGPEPTTLFATTETPKFIPKDTEEEARRILQSTILEAKKTVDDDIGFMSKSVTIPPREETTVAFHEFVVDHPSTVTAASVEAPAVTSTVSSNNAEPPKGKQPIRAPVQCNPSTKAPSLSAHPTVAFLTDAHSVPEPAQTKVEVKEEESEGPAKMAIARPTRVVNRVVQTDMQIADIA